MRKLKTLIADRYRLSLVVNTENPDHHIWINLDGTWWMKLTVWGLCTKRRIDLPLHTRSREDARRLRDEIIAYLPHARNQTVKRLMRTKRRSKGFFVCQVSECTKNICGDIAREVRTRGSAERERIGLAQEENR